MGKRKTQGMIMTPSQKKPLTTILRKLPGPQIRPTSYLSCTNQICQNALLPWDSIIIIIHLFNGIFLYWKKRRGMTVSAKLSLGQPQA